MKKNKLKIRSKMLFISSIKVIKEVSLVPKTIYYENKYLTTSIFTEIKKEKCENGICNDKTVGFLDLNDCSKYRYYKDKNLHYYYKGQQLVEAFIGLDNFICTYYNNKLVDLDFLNFLAHIIIDKIDDINDFYNIICCLKNSDLEIFDKELFEELYRSYLKKDSFVGNKKVLNKSKEGYYFIR